MAQLGVLRCARCRAAARSGARRDRRPARRRDGAIRIVTLAPERSGSADAIKRLTDAGVVVAVGRTTPPTSRPRRPSTGGHRGRPHVQRDAPLHHRDPGPALALLEDPRVTVELIADGVHVHPALVRQVIETAGPDRVALISDAMAAAGLPDGSFRLGTLEVDVVGRVARLRGMSTITGSTASIDQLFRTAVGRSARRRMGRWPPPCR